MIGSKLQHFLLKHCIRRLIIKKVYFGILHGQKEKQQSIDPKVQTFQKLHGISDDKFTKFCETSNRHRISTLEYGKQHCWNKIISTTMKILCFIVNSTMLELLNSTSIVSYQLQRNLIITISNKTMRNLFGKLKNNNKSTEPYVFRRISPTKFLPRSSRYRLLSTQL